MIELPLLVERRYRLDRLVGEGGFGRVYAGRHLTLDVPIAVKVLRAGAQEKHAALAARFMEEGRLLTRLRHPNIVAALDLGFLPPGADGSASPFLVMEWVEGETLEDLLAKRDRAMTVGEAWELFEPLLEALAFAHAERVVHRDLKPANVMVVAGERGDLVPRVIDFGVAKIAQPEEEGGTGDTSTASPGSPFTPKYAAPEQISQARTGPWTDVHALGLLFVELVTGRAPYDETHEIRLAVIDPERPSARAAGVDIGPLEAVVARSVALRPRDRFRDAAEMLAAAREAAAALAGASVDGKAAFPPPSAEPPAKQRPITRPVATSTSPLTSSLDETVPSSRVPSPVIETAPPPVPRARIARRAALALGGAAIASAAAYFTLVRHHAAPAIPHLDDISTDELASRIEREGFKVTSRLYNPDPRLVRITWSEGWQWTWTVEVVKLVTVPGNAGPDERMAALAAAVAERVKPPDRAVYGLDDGSESADRTPTLAVLWTNAGEHADKVFDSIFRDVTFALKESQFAADTQLASWAQTHKPTFVPAKRVAELTSAEASKRLVDSGADVLGVTAMGVNFRYKGFIGSIIIHRVGGAAAVGATREMHAPFAYAIDGESAVVVMGDSSLADKKFLATLLAGLGADVHEEGAR